MLDTKILVIEDDIEDFVLVSDFLSFSSQKRTNALHHCSTLKEGLKCLEEKKSVDLVLLDLGLSDTQGLDTFTQFNQAYPEMPLIVVSGNSDEDIALKALKRGAQDYLVKGKFDRSLLRRSVRYALERHGHRLELESNNKILRHLSDQLKLANQELRKLASIDSLTRLYNRRRFDESYKAEWCRMVREEKPLSVIMCDVDFFKAYNDTYGHPMGDRCLQNIAQAIRKACKRPADIVARYGGEEFIIALPDTDSAGAIYIAEKIRTELANLKLSHRKSPISSSVTLSLGIATQIPRETTSSAQLIDSADRALYAAKDRGRNRFELHYADDAYDKLKARQNTLQWVRRIREAIELDKFELYAQPIQPLWNHQICHQYEILLRLCDQPGLIHLPNLFLPVAEEYHLMTKIDHWVISKLFERLEQYQHSAPLHSRFYINLSSSTCRQDSIANFIESKLQKHNLPAENFCFEISETLASEHLQAASDLTKALQSLNCQVALDDFGGGMTSFKHLREIPVNYVKIDGIFVQNIATDQVSQAIVKCIHQIASLMNLETIAEFVESEPTLNILNDIGINHAQGHYFDHAKPLTHIMKNGI